MSRPPLRTEKAMFSHSSPTFHIPQTPTGTRHRSKDFSVLSFKPVNSSPLAPPLSPGSSPISAAQARRKSQYKSNSRRVSTASSSKQGADIFASPDNEGRKAIMRLRFDKRCQEARDSEVKRRRYSGGTGNIFDNEDDAMDDDREETDDDILKDELFRRIILNANHNAKHKYRVSYQQEVGSSFDPDLEDIGQWEAELQEEEEGNAVELSPEDLDAAELAAYAQEAEILAVLEDFDDLPPDAFDDDGLSEFGDAQPGDAMDTD